MSADGSTPNIEDLAAANLRGASGPLSASDHLATSAFVAAAAGGSLGVGGQLPGTSDNGDDDSGSEADLRPRLRSLGDSVTSAVRFELEENVGSEEGEAEVGGGDEITPSGPKDEVDERQRMPGGEDDAQRQASSAFGAAEGHKGWAGEGRAEEGDDDVLISRRQAGRGMGVASTSSGLSRISPLPLDPSSSASSTALGSAILGSSAGAPSTLGSSTLGSSLLGTSMLSRAWPGPVEEAAPAADGPAVVMGAANPPHVGKLPSPFAAYDFTQISEAADDEAKATGRKR